jgi:RNA recognition motif-containing protein
MVLHRALLRGVACEIDSLFLECIMKLLIRNLARTTTEKELRALFEPHGAVQSCNLVLDAATGQSKGFGFVVMSKPGEAKAAMKTLNGKEVSGSKIRVKKANKPEKE